MAETSENKQECSQGYLEYLTSSSKARLSEVSIFLKNQKRSNPPSQNLRAAAPDLQRPDQGGGPAQPAWASPPIRAETA
ncbi:MAG: hypothetical protein FWD67_10405 [Betaproteobacteria bacterium]|nr:hypothetical protein [Betaproteobacteria bacterium]